MKAGVLAAALAALAPVLCAQEPPRPAYPAGGEPDSYRARSPRAEFEVVVEPAARAARRLIYEERRRRLARRVSSPPARAAREPTPIWVEPEGLLVGLLYEDSHNSFGMELDGDGKTRKVIVSGGESGGQPALFFRLLDSAGKEFARVVVTAFGDRYDELR